MKATKKLLAILLAAVMLMAVLPSAFATESTADTTYSLTIAGTTEGHTYYLYQVFTGAVSNQGGQLVLSDVKYGSSWKTQTAGALVPSSVLDGFQGTTATADGNIATFLADIGSPYGTYTSQATSTKIDDLPAGYYLLMEAEADNLPDGETMTKHILQVVGDTSVQLKASTVTSEKKVKDTNDSTGVTSDWQDSADYDIGDDVPFRLTAKVSEKLSDFKGPYAMTFHDHESEGLTFNKDSVKVYIETTSGRELLTTGYTVYTNGSETSNPCTFEIHFSDLRALKEQGVEPGCTIAVEYTSRLNSKAKIGSAGNPNEMHITFSNNPNVEEPHEEGKTPDDKVTVFTFQLVVNKVQPGEGEENVPLFGAAFKLSKKNSSGTYVQVAELGKDEVVCEFTFKGLDDGEYKLEETVTPAGFNTIAPIEFTITAEHDILSNDPQLRKLTGGKLATGELNVDGYLPDGSITTDVLNIAGKTLPTTGGSGTTIFYIVGSILVVCAGVLLISKKRMNGAR